MFDSADLGLRKSGSMLRIRTVGGECVLTWKGPARKGRHKDREEIETAAGDARALASVLERLGFHPVFRYEKYRTEYRRAGQRGIAMLDETPIGTYLEVEGPARWIDAAARDLGYSPGDYITASYGALYLEHRGREPMATADMVFRRR